MTKHVKLFEDLNSIDTKNIGNLAVTSLLLRDQTHIFHWQSKNKGEHETLEEFYDELLEITDNLIEACMGKFGRFSVKGIELTDFVDIDSIECEEYMNLYFHIYSDFRNETFKDDPEIQAIIDELLILINKIKYLLSMAEEEKK
jgi:hypothetical protein